MKIKFLKDRYPFLKGDIVETGTDQGNGLLSTGEQGSCVEAGTDEKAIPRETLTRRAEDRKAKEAAKLKKAAAAKAKE